MELELLQQKRPMQTRSPRTQMHTALQSMLARLDAIDVECGPDFPLYAPAQKKRWQTSQGGSWVGGFWAGCWWLRAKHSGSEWDRLMAAKFCARLNDKLTLDSCYRSFIFRYGALAGSDWFADEQARTQAAAAAKALAASYDADMGAIPLGTGLGGGEHGRNTVVIDAFAPLIELLTFSGNAEHEAIARRHADTLMAACMEASGAFYPEAQFIDGRFERDHLEDSAGEWSRGQAWGMLGLVRAAERWGEPYQTAAEQACNYWRRTRTLPLPPNHLAAPVGLRDPSAAVIAATAMAALGELNAGSAELRRAARQTLLAVVQSSYFKRGAFEGCCYALTPGRPALGETAWGHFLLMSALDRMLVAE